MPTYKSNMDSVILKVTGKLRKAVDVSILQRTVGSYLLASNIRRIHNDGVAVNGSRIGSYDRRNPLYVNPNRSPKKFVTKGKTGKTKFKNGSPHKTRWFESYSAFRSEIGREASKVNLQLSGRLKLSLKLEQEGKNWVVGFDSEYGASVSEGQEKKWGKRIWGISEKDRVQIKKVVEDMVNEMLKK